MFSSFWRGSVRSFAVLAFFDILFAILQEKLVEATDFQDRI